MSEGGEAPSAKRRRTDGGEQGDRQEEKEPIWRSDPGESYSDFAIVVAEQGAAAASLPRRYHVHKVALLANGIGFTHSEYFNGLLREGGECWPKEKKEIQITLDAEAAAEFPAFLDFLYAGKLQVEDLSLKRSILLTHLADYFQVPILTTEIWKKYLDGLNNYTPEDMAGCLSTIIKYPTVGAVAVLYRSARLCIAEAVLENRPYLPQYLAQMDAPLFLRVLKLCNKLITGRKLLENDFQDTSLSKAVCEYIDIHKTRLSKKDFKSLTSDRALPSIAPEVALKLLEVEADFFAATSASNGLSSLQRRCFTALKASGGVDDVNEAERVFAKLPARAFALSYQKIPNGDSGESNAQAGSHCIQVFTSYGGFNGVYKKSRDVAFDGNATSCYKMTGTSELVNHYIFKHQGIWKLMRYSTNSNQWERCFISPQGTRGTQYPPPWGWRWEGRLTGHDSHPLLLLFKEDETDGDGR